MVETLGGRYTDTELIGLGIAAAAPEAVEVVATAAGDCGVGPEVVDAALAAFLGG